VKLEKEYRLVLSEEDFQKLRDLVKHGNVLSDEIDYKKDKEPLTKEHRIHLAEEWNNLVKPFEIVLML
jgi:hypothetical protein